MPKAQLKKPRLLILSHVLPYSRRYGQQQRVYYTLKAVREFFHVTFAAPVDAKEMDQARNKMAGLCDEVLLFPAKYSRNRITKEWYRFTSSLYSLRTGLKTSNYLIGRLEFAPSRVASLFKSYAFDLVLFEYCYAYDGTSFFQRKGTPCVLDMHNVLWQSYARQLNDKAGLPGWWKERALTRYKKQEEEAWKHFDGIIAINTEEEKYVRKRVPGNISLFYAPMGIDMDLWPYLWRPAYPPRIGYYAGLGSAHNQRNALISYKRIMPKIWREFPKAELWLVGGNPPRSLKALSSDSRVKVPGYIEDVQHLLSTMSVVVCPWSGTYGFRSRLVEVMALGVPVAASPDAVYGMGMDIGQGLFLKETDRGLAQACLDLIRDPAFAKKQSELARKQVEEKFGFDATYGKLARDLSGFSSQVKGRGSTYEG